MSQFIADPEHLDALADHLVRWGNKAAALGQLPTEDFGSWMGDPLVALLTSDFAKTIKNEVVGLADAIGWRADNLRDGARAYREVDQAAVRGGGGH